MRGVFVIAIALWVCSGSACSGSSHDTEPARPHARAVAPAPPPSSTGVADVPPLPPSTYPAPDRLIAIGDVHGDLDAFESALVAAGAIDAADHWIGGTLYVVQVGDLLDRGDQERAIFELVDRLEDEALAAGGRLIALNGNHEFMNTEGDFRYVTPGGYADFAPFAADATGPAYDAMPRTVRGRAAAFRPGGPYARGLASHATIVMVGETLFVHGGAQASYLEDGLDEINQDGRAFFLGQAPLSQTLAADDGPIWYRGFALADDPATCARLDDALAVVHARRMVIGHTKQEHGITTACEGHVVRVDVGLARIYDGPIEVLEITGDTTRVISGTR